MAKTKYIMHECGYCHKQTKMELVGGMTEQPEGDTQKLWYRCSRCKHTALLTLTITGKEKKGAPLAIDRSNCVEYSAEKVYTVGQEIYHPGLDDMGRVIRKDKTSGGSHSIVVAFMNAGERKLLENAHELPADDVIVAPATGSTLA